MNWGGLLFIRISINRQQWEDRMLCNDRDESNGSKLPTYRTYQTTLSAECYVEFNMRRDYRRILARFRSRNLPIAIETGRFTKP